MDFIPVDADFSDTAVINICSNVEYSSKPLVWTFSTYLNIIGHRFDDISNQIFAKFSTLPIGMFALRECPHDPNKLVFNLILLVPQCMSIKYSTFSPEGSQLLATINGSVFWIYRLSKKIMSNVSRSHRKYRGKCSHWHGIRWTKTCSVSARTKEGLALLTSAKRPMHPI